MLVATSTKAAWMVVIFMFSPGHDLVRTITLPNFANSKAECEQWRHKAVPKKDRDGWGLTYKSVCLSADDYPEFWSRALEDVEKEMD
jgi:hypothetical protein